MKLTKMDVKAEFQGAAGYMSHGDVFSLYARECDRSYGIMEEWRDFLSRYDIRRCEVTGLYGYADYVVDFGQYGACMIPDQDVIASYLCDVLGYEAYTYQHFSGSIAYRVYPKGKPDMYRDFFDCPHTGRIHYAVERMIAYLEAKYRNL